MKIETIKFSQLCNPTSRQQEAFEALKKFTYILYGGATYGGKSYWLRWALVKLLLTWFGKTGLRNIRVGMFCEDYPTLRDRQIVEVKTTFPAWLGSYNKSDKEFVLAPQYGSGVIAFRNLDDPSKYASSQFAAIAIDEIVRNKEHIFNFLRMRNRWTGIDDPKFIAACNPDGIGRLWVKKLWIDGIFDPNEKEAKTFKYVPATISDNPYASLSYKKSMDSLPEKLRKAYRDGSWDTFEGQFFSEWDNTVHIIRPFDVMPLLRKDRGYMFMDYGWTAPSSIGWIAKNEKQRYHYRELYRTKMTPIMVAEEIVKMTRKEEIPFIDCMYCDPSMWSSKAGEASIAKIIEEYFAEHNFYVKLKPANNDRHTRAYAMRENLKVYQDYNGERTANCQVFENCVNFIRTVPSLTFSKRDPEDVETKSEDHAYDGYTYGLITDAGIKTSNIKDVLEENLERNELISAGDNW